VQVDPERTTQVRRVVDACREASTTGSNLEMALLLLCCVKLFASLSPTARTAVALELIRLALWLDPHAETVQWQ